LIVTVAHPRRAWLAKGKLNLIGTTVLAGGRFLRGCAAAFFTNPKALVSVIGQHALVGRDEATVGRNDIFDVAA
jgi:hypothetical protein